MGREKERLVYEGKREDYTKRGKKMLRLLSEVIVVSQPRMERGKCTLREKKEYGEKGRKNAEVCC